ncbi:MAG: SpoVG family protein [Clostridiales bacterium]|nr:SpoVG family protein [Clostridiales bacterium]
MKITDIKVRLMYEQTSRVKATVSLTLDGCMAIHDILIVEGDRGLFLAMPSRRCSDGIYRDIIHPLNQDTRAAISKLCLQAYDCEKKKQNVCISGKATAI